MIAEIEPGATEGGGAFVSSPTARAAIELALREAARGRRGGDRRQGPRADYQEFAGRTVIPSTIARSPARSSSPLGRRA